MTLHESILAIKDKPVKEIATTLSISINTVYRHINGTHSKRGNEEQHNTSLRVLARREQKEGMFNIYERENWLI